MSLFTVLVSALSAFGQVNYVHCETLGATLLDVRVHLNEDLYHDDFDNGYELMVKTSPSDKTTLLEIVIEAGSDRIFSTQQKVRLDSAARTLIHDPVADFWLKCRVY